MAKPNLRHNLFIFIVTILFVANAKASERRELFMRTGITTGTFQGQDVKDGKFTTDVNLLGELWLYSSPETAWTFRFLLADESKLGRARYFGAGIGQRFFINSDGIMTDAKSGSDFYKIKPNWAYYVGWDTNLAQFLVVPVSSVLSSYSTVLDLGGTLGVKRIINPKLSADAMLTYTFGYSLASASSVTVNMIRAMAGIGYSF